MSISTLEPSRVQLRQMQSWPIRLALLGLLGAAFLGIAYASAIREMVNVWLTSEEYSHGVLMPLISIFLIWRQRAQWLQIQWQGSWVGFALVVVALLINLLGQLSAVLVLQQYALVLTLYGMVLALAGLQVVRVLWAPLLIFIFMVPPPNFFMNNLSAQLQLLSSQIGVWTIRAFGISVFLEGNVIDLGTYKLQVAEACSGLRYLFPLMTLGFIVAYLFKVAMWKRVWVFASSIPVTILMNSFRIGLIGVTVEHWGVKMAEGFLHDFEGWMVFMCSAAVLLVEMMVLASIGKQRKPWREVFGLEVVHATPTYNPLTTLTTTSPFMAAVVCVGVVALAVFAMPERAEAVPVRESFASFPDQVAHWRGRRENMEQVYLDVLKLNDYITSNYVSARGEPVNFYVAWYDSQRAGQSAHSPRSCLPGGGWRIVDLQSHRVEGVELSGAPLVVNRAVIVSGQQRQLVYYWFQQRGRVITNEYMVKWYLFWDSLTRNRTDGALVRLVAPIHSGAPMELAEKNLTEFLVVSAPQLPRFIPN